jgi:hypothetical protein
MPFELLHFRESEEILKDTRMLKEIESLLKFIDNTLHGSLCKARELRVALSEKGWRENGTLTIVEGRKYQYKGFKNRVAIDGNFSAYEVLGYGLCRLQVGYDKGKIDTGVLLITGLRSENSPFGSTLELVESELEKLYPTISMPVSVAVFDLGSVVAEEKGIVGSMNKSPPEL